MPDNGMSTSLFAPKGFCNFSNTWRSGVGWRINDSSLPTFPVIRCALASSRSAIALWSTADVHQITMNSHHFAMGAASRNGAIYKFFAFDLQLWTGLLRSNWRHFRKIVWKQWRKDHWIFLNALLSPACNGQCGFMEWLPPAVHNILWITIFPKAWISNFIPNSWRWGCASYANFLSSDASIFLKPFFPALPLCREALRHLIDGGSNLHTLRNLGFGFSCSLEFL